jgi:SAM-dependent methyltransferase
MEHALTQTPPPNGLFAPPRVVTRPEDCFFYHTIDAPGYGTIPGEWDLRGHVDGYLGGTDLRGKRVLELGTASGFLCAEMERRGAEVVAFDLSDEHDGDLVPFARRPDPRAVADRRGFVRRLNNGWWLVHRAFRSSARLVYGSVYDVPEAVGEVDVATFGSILMHLRDPFLALASAARLTREAVVVTEHTAYWSQFAAADDPGPPRGLRGWLLGRAHRLLGDGGWPRREADLAALLRAPLVAFLPSARDPGQDQAWWAFRPGALCEMLGALGFPHTTITYTDGPLYLGRPQRLLTVVGRR